MARTPSTSERRLPGLFASHRPNQVWSADLTTVNLWGLWPVHVLVAVDHFSRRLMAAVPIRRPTAECAAGVLARAFEAFGAPVTLVTDHGGCFIGKAFTQLLNEWNVRQVLGAVGQHASVAITERLIETLKYEWLRRVSIIRSAGHLADLCESFSIWYNNWRPHQGIAGNRPDDVYRGLPPPVPICRLRKVVPPDVEQLHFAEPRITAWRLKNCA